MDPETARLWYGDGTASAPVAAPAKIKLPDPFEASIEHIRDRSPEKVRVKLERQFLRGFDLIEVLAPVKKFDHGWLIPVKAYSEPWSKGHEATILVCTFDPVRWKPKNGLCPDSIGAKDHARFSGMIGEDWAFMIYDNRSLINSIRLNKGPKRDFVRKQIIKHVEFVRGLEPERRKIFEAYRAADLPYFEAVRLTAIFKPGGSPWQHHFEDELTFLRAIKFAYIIDPKRAAAELDQARIVAALKEDKHTAYNCTALEEVAFKLFDMDRLKIGEAIKKLEDSKIIVRTAAKSGDLLSFKPLYDAERAIAEYAKGALTYNLTDKEKAVARRCIKNAAFILGIKNLELDPEQEAGVWAILENQICFIIGPPGSGKTRVVAALAFAILRTLGHPSRGASLSGRAADNLGRACRVEVAGSVYNLSCATLHHSFWIGVSKRKTSARRKLVPHREMNVDCFFLDEVFMNDSRLMDIALRGVSNQKIFSHIVLIGDPRQCPPIGFGTPALDLLRSGLIKTVELTTHPMIFGAGSHIPRGKLSCSMES
jgi:hypothetical protein